MTPEAAEALGTQLMQGVKMLVGKMLAPLSARLATMEVRVGAISMQSVRGAGGPEQLAELEALLERVKKLDALEARIKTLETRPTMGYEGVWRSGVGYMPG